MDLSKILPTQKNILIDFISQSGLGIRNFEISKDGSSYKYIGTEFFFYFIVGPRYQKHVYYSPGLHTVEVATEVSFATFVHPSTEFSRWLENLKREIIEPDYFELLRNQSVENRLTEEDEYFSPEERSQITEKVEEIRQEFSEQDLVQEQLDAVNKKLDDAIKLLDKLNKGQWKSLFIGSIISLALDAVIPLEIITPIWEKIKFFFIRLTLGT